MPMSFKKQLSYTLFFILIFPFVLNASNLSKMYIEGNGKRLRNAIVPQDTLDANGLQASMIRIITDMKGSLKFDSNRGIIGSNVKPGQTDIFLSKHTRQIKIFKEGFEPLELILSDFGVVLEEGAVFELKLVSDKKKDIAIISEPPDAERIIDGKSLGKSETLKIPFGKHTLTLKKEGYKTKHIKIEIDDTTTLLKGKQFKLEEIEPIGLKIDSSPQGAKVFINEQDEGITPYAAYKFPAVYKLRIVKNGYVPIEKKIEIRDDQNTFFYNLIKNASYINLKVVPFDATVLIDGKDYTNKSNIEIAPGKHTISVTKNSYLAFTKEIDLKVGETLMPNPLEINLIKNISYINLKVVPSDATVLIDGKDYTNKSNIEVAPGKHTINVTKSSYLAFTKEIDLKVGETLMPNPLKINLTNNTGVINLTINPSDAKVFVNNIEQKVINNRIELAPATYKIEIKKQGYDSASKVISLKLKDEIDLNFNLKEQQGKLRFSVNPANANILLLKNNKEIEKWQGLKYIKNLPVGEYEIVAKQEGYKTYKKKILIEKNKINILKAILEEKQNKIVKKAVQKQEKSNQIKGIKFNGSDSDFSFTKISEDGKKLPKNAQKWSCVLDNKTGLMWEVKTKSGLHDEDDQFKWKKTFKFANNINKKGLCGYKDWRVPTIDELISIVDYPRKNPAIDENFFPNTKSFYWSSSVYAGNADKAWELNFYNGHDNWGYKTDSYYVRLVRSRQ